MSVMGESNIRLWVILFSTFICFGLIIFSLIYQKDYADKVPKSMQIAIMILLIWNTIGFFRGLFEIKNYEDFRDFFSDETQGLAGFAPLFFFIGIRSADYVRIFKSFRLFLILLIPLPIFVDLSSIEGAVTPLLIYVLYLILLIPNCSNKEKIFITIWSVLCIYNSMQNRSAFTRIGFCYGILLYVYLFNAVVKVKLWVIIASVFLLITPVFFLYQGIRGDNIFERGASSVSERTEEESLNSDTRTFLYVEVFGVFQSRKDLFLGKGVYAAYKTDFLDMGTRRYTEVGFLTMLLRFGVIGVVLYLVVLVMSVYNGISKSQNLYIQSVAIFVSFYWLFLFIENVIAFNMLNFVFWFLVGVISVSSNCNLKDEEIKPAFIGESRKIRIGQFTF